MNKRFFDHRFERAMVLGFVLVLAACGSHAASEVSAGAIAGGSSASIIRDPQNPNWSGATLQAERATGSTASLGLR